MVNSMKTIINGLKTFVTRKIESINMPKPDYDENDPNSINYVQNRPFYDYMADRTLEFSNVGTSGQMMLSLGYGEPLLSGEKYTITVNGDSYVTEAILYKNGYVCLFGPGNDAQSLFNYCIAYDPDASLYAAHTWWSEGSNISITGPFRVFKQLDDKYYNAVKSVNGNTGDLEITAESIGAAKCTNRSYPWGNSNTFYKRKWIGYQSGDTLSYAIRFDDKIGLACYSDDNGRYLVLGNAVNVILRNVDKPIKYNDAVNLDYLNTQLATKISTPSTATVGQTIAVKAVDETGKPTEWEATDMLTESKVTDLINTALGVIENGTY